MKVFVLTHCVEEGNYKPRVFKNEEDAIEALKKSYNECLGEGDVDSDDLYSKSVHVIYTDDTYNFFEIYEAEVE